VDLGGRKHLGVGLGLLALLAGCASLPDRAARPDAVTAGPAASPAAGPTIPQAVPVEVPTLEEMLAADAEAALAESATPEADQAAELPPPGELLDRVRTGLALGPHYNSRIDREVDYFATHTEYVERVFDRAAPYLYYITTEVEARGLPLELALLPVIESAFQPYAYSHARASGLWQFMAATGSRFQLKQDWWYDGRRDVVAATNAALDYLTYLHDLFDGNWLHAIAAYNCGEGNVKKAIRRNRAAGKRTDFWNLKLPAETRGYVPRLLAMTRIVAEPEKYGLMTIEGIPDAPYFVKVETGGQISIEVAAELAGITTEEMYELNPAYHRWATDPTGPHILLVPVASADAFRDNVLLLTPDQRMRVERYAVREGDTVNAVAQRFNTTVQHLRELNELGSASVLAVGAELRVPSSVNSLPDQVLQAAARVDSRGRSGSTTVHVVRRGDSLWSIAQRHKMSINRLASLNGISTKAALRVGQRLKLQSTGASTVASNGPRNSTPASDSGRRVTYVVRRGDTLSGIARTLKVSVAS
jgi:membrane-bound lytic murein transglycosylase D